MGVLRDPLFYSIITAMIRDFSIEDFIGVFNTSYDTQPLIDYWKYQDKVGATFRRGGTFGGGQEEPGARQDTCFATEDFMLTHDIGFKYVSEYNMIIGKCLELYIKKFEELKRYRYQQVYLNVQRTLPTEGFHAWHSEDGSMGSNRRLLATMMYLNDVNDGGETEFLYQSKRFKPTKGQVLIWPAGFTHVHRGNPPLSGEKFISTSWLENINA